VTGFFSDVAGLFADDELAADPVKWAKERCGIHLWSIQQEIAHSLTEHSHIAIRSANGLGKSFLAATLVAWWVDTHPAEDTWVITTAPSETQVHTILWEEIRGIHRRAGLPGKVQLTDRWLIGNTEVAMGRKPPDHNETAFLGIHAINVLVVLDEACGIPEWLWNSAERLATSGNCKILAIGNPDNPNSHFASIFRNPDWQHFRISAFDSPNFTGEEVPDDVREKLTQVSWVEKRKQDWGESNPLYISGVLGEFPQDSASAVIRMSDIYACRIPEPRIAGELLPVELGIDVGGGGDETIIRERRGMIAGREWRETSDRPEAIARLAVHAINITGATAVKVDSNGIGFGLVGELRNLKELGHHSARIYGVNVSEKASRPDKYFNLRSQLWWEVGRVASEQKAWDLSQMENSDITVAQMLEPQYELDLKGRIKVEPKDDIKKRIGRSPDNADALLLAFYAPKAFATEWFEAIRQQSGIVRGL
jgi:hypothetical protein